jgi:hypothetical protein
MTGQRAGWACGEIGSTGQWLTIFGPAHQRPGLHRSRDAAQAAPGANPRLKTRPLADIQVAHLTEVPAGGLAYRSTGPPAANGGAEQVASAGPHHSRRRTRLLTVIGPHKKAGDTRHVPAPARRGVAAHNDYLAPTACRREVATTLATRQDNLVRCPNCLAAMAGTPD